MSAVLPSAGTSWTAQQRQWLAALGHVLYVPAGGPEADAVATAAGSRAPESTDAAAGPETAGAAGANPPRRAPRAAAPHADASPHGPPAPRPPADAPRVRTARLPDKLHFALIRASGCNPNAPGAAELFAQWPGAAQLRGDPAAKRALWPALRALRRRGAGPQ